MVGKNSLIVAGKPGLGAKVMVNRSFNRGSRPTVSPNILTESGAVKEPPWLIHNKLTNISYCLCDGPSINRFLFPPTLGFLPLLSTILFNVLQALRFSQG
jgi:hypothetical protein